MEPTAIIGACAIGGAVATVAFALLGRTRHGAAREAAGWMASVLLSAAVLPVVAFVGGFVLYLPVLGVDDGSGAIAPIAWLFAIVLTSVVIAVAYRLWKARSGVRFLIAPTLILGLGTVWLGRYLATVDWLPSPS